MRARMLLLAFAASLAGCGSCRKSTGGADAAATGDAGPTAFLPALRVERFIAARPRDGGVELAAIARDRTVILARLDSELRTIDKKVLASDVEATEPTDVTLIGDGLVVVVGKLAVGRGAFLLREGKPPLSIGIDRCTLGDGVSWIERKGRSVSVRIVRSSVDVTTPPIDVPEDSEVHLSCGPDSAVVSVRDGEHLSIAVVPASGAAEAPKLVEIEKEGELEDELRERVILARPLGTAVILRVGAASLHVREIDASSSGAWTKVSGGAISDETDVVEAAVAPTPKGAAYLLVSEPASGTCSDGDPPRRIVLHEIKGSTSHRRPLVELPCGLEAIRAHLHADAKGASMWWTEPVDAKTCAHPGLTVSAIVTATSDKPGAKRTAVVAEGVASVGDGRFLAVTRPSGCVPWAAEGNGALVWVAPPK